MILIVGLGNPGEKYEQTRHNIGFMVVDDLAEENLTGDVELLKPQTGMNKSGQAVKGFLMKHNLKSQNIWLVHDDVDLDLGQVRFRKEGSTTHKGVQSVVDALGTTHFKRVRVGIGPLPSGKDIEDFVLEEFSKKEHHILQEIIRITVDRIGEFLQKGFQEETLSTPPLDK